MVIDHNLKDTTSNTLVRDSLEESWARGKINWRTMETPPEDGEQCLTEMKHGLISGIYDSEDKVFRGYYWHDMEWKAKKWVPVSEIT